MELRVLRYFLAVAREENITKSAALLHVTQPTLSRQLMQLEDELGVKLFRRSQYRVVLTEDGMLLRRRAQEIVELADKAERELQHTETELTGEIAIGCGETAAMTFLSEHIRAFRRQHPLLISGRESVRNELAGWFGDTYEKIEVAATFNLILNAANMVKNGVGAALCYDFGNLSDALIFVPLFPKLETGTVLAWKKDQAYSSAAKQFLDDIKNTL